MILAHLVFDPDTDRVLIRVPAADRDGDVTLLALDLDVLDAAAKQRLRDVREVDQEQPTPEFDAYKANVQAAMEMRDEVDAFRDEWLIDLAMKTAELEDRTAALEG